MGQPERIAIFAAAAKIQTAVGTPAVPTFAANAIRLVGKNQLTIDYIDKGDRADEQHAGMGVIGQGPKSGRYGQVDIAGPVMGGITDYFGGTVRPWWDPFIRGAGFSTTESGTTGSGIVTYTTLDDGTFEAFTLLLQSARQLFTLQDCIAIPKLSAVAGGRPQWTFTVIGAMPNDAVDSTFAGQTLDFTAAPAFKGQTTSIGAFTSVTNGPCKMRKLDLDFGTAHTPRSSAGATDVYLGEVITDRILNFSCEVEKVAKSVWDPEAISREPMPGGTDRKVNFQFGGAKFNEVKFSLGQFLFDTPVITDSSGLATWPLKGKIQARSLTGGREITIVVD